MTNDFDDLLSAYIDGQATPEEVARVEADPELRAQAESLRALSDQLSAGITPLPSTVRSRHVAGAMAAFDETVSGASGGQLAGRDQNVVDL